MRKRNVVGTVIMGAIGRRGERKGGAYKEGKRERELEEKERGGVGPRKDLLLLLSRRLYLAHMQKSLFRPRREIHTCAWYELLERSPDSSAAKCKDKLLPDNSFAKNR